MHSLYVHIPFCRHRCGYCDFNTYSGLDHLIPDYIASLEQEVREVGEGGARPSVHTVFLGGGTPSMLSAAHLSRLLLSIREAFDLDPNAEVTLEANPGGLEEEYLSRLHGSGFNRISLGVQSIHPSELAVLEREHGLEHVLASVAAARAAGFTNLNLDLIFGVPGQSLASWNESLTRILDLHPEHLSLYALTLENGTPLRRAVRAGRVTMPEDDLAAEMYELASQRLQDAGFRQYEISNWARASNGPDQVMLACRHNLQYWRNAPYFGLGAGAHGYARGRRYSNVLAPATYLRRMRTAARGAFPLSRAAARSEVIAVDEEMRQTMWLGLRLTEEGVPVEAFRTRFGRTPEEIFTREIAESIDRGLIERTSQPARLRLTARGRLLANQVFVRFV
jgi:putative oxygen-independent coproporphyrinogen III oxidase